jgi:hypothetical protein
LKCFSSISTFTRIVSKHSQQFAMPAPAWLHVNGIRLTSDNAQYQSRLNGHDNRTKNVKGPTSSPASLLSSSSIMFSDPITPIEVCVQHNQQNRQKHEQIELSKKMLVDRQVKRTSSLPRMCRYDELFSLKSVLKFNMEITRDYRAHQYSFKMKSNQIFLITV